MNILMEEKLQVQNLQALSSLTKLQHFDGRKVTTTEPASPLLSCPHPGTGGCCRGSTEKNDGEFGQNCQNQQR